MHSNKLKKVVVAGSTGLIGSRLMENLMSDVTVSKMIVLARTKVEFNSPKVETLMVDFNDLSGVESKIQDADTLFCCVGTTMKIAGSKEAFRKVDYQIPIDLARLASKAHIKTFIAISSLGADPESTNFYLKTKGEMERDIDAGFKFNKLAFVRPSMLLGPRHEFRLGERLGQFFMLLFSFLMVGRIRKYRPVNDYKVAKAMVSIAGSLNNQKVYESSELEWIGR